MQKKSQRVIIQFGVNYRSTFPSKAIIAQYIFPLSTTVLSQQQFQHFFLPDFIASHLSTMFCCC